MNKQQLVQRYNHIADLLAVEIPGMPRPIVMAGGAMVLMGMRKETQDLDIEVSMKAFCILGRSGKYRTTKSPFGGTIIHYRDGVDIFMYSNEDYAFMGNLPHQTPEAILDLKRRMNRPKDQSDIAILEERLLRCA